MHASTIKEWTTANGDFIRVADHHRDDSYEAMRRYKSTLKTRLTFAFGMTALGAVILVLEILSRV